MPVVGPALEDLAERMRARGINVTLRIDLDFERGGSAARPVPELEDTIYRVAHEALTNVVKHAHATEAEVVVGEAASAVELFVRDDGRGFDNTAVTRSRRAHS